MKHRSPHRRMKRKFRHLAAAFAGAAIMSSALLPGVSHGVVHASPSKTSANGPSVTASQRVVSAYDLHNNFTVDQANEQKPAPAAINKARNAPSAPTAKTNAPVKATPAPVQLAPIPVPAQPKPDLTPPIPDKAPSPAPETPASAPETTAPAPETPIPEATAPAPETAAPGTALDITVAPPETAAPALDITAPASEAAAPAPTGNVPVSVASSAQKVIPITATAYAPGAADNDQWGDKTYLGTKVRPGIIAVDPNVIPLGSLVYIQYPNGNGGFAVAEDTGGAIKGNRIDVAMSDRGQAKDFGIQHVKVYVVSK